MSSAKDPPALADDAWLAVRVEAALAPYAGVVSTDELAWIREQVTEALANDPHAAAVVARAHPRTRDRSGEVKKPSSDRNDLGKLGKAKG